jgi:Streptomyces sporulation and cell division protein, SsgA
MARRPRPGYSCPLTLHLVGPRSWTEVPSVFSYDPADPFAVRISFGTAGPSGRPDGVVWLVARELLQTGLERPAGDGDVRVWPAASSADALFLHLRAPSGEALFELSRATLSAFLRETAAVVPVGAESSAVDLDDELAALLSNGGADPTGR